jgi:hypothetical protein
MFYFFVKLNRLYNKNGGAKLRNSGNISLEYEFFN